MLNACPYIKWRLDMDITENRIEDMLRNTVFTNNAHKEALRKKIRSGIVELGEDELEMVAGGVEMPGDFHLIDESCDGFIQW